MSAGCLSFALRGLPLTAIAVMLCACAALGAPTQQGYNTAMETWVGEPTSDLIARWGQPANRYLGPNGGIILQYTRTTSATQAASTSEAGITPGGGANAAAEEFRSASQSQGESAQATFTCTTRFIADSGGVIRQFQFAGTACRAEAPQDGHWGTSVQPLLSPRAASATSAG